MPTSPASPTQPPIVFLALKGYEHYYDAIIAQLQHPHQILFDWTEEAVLATQPLVVVSAHSIPTQIQALIPRLRQKGIPTVGLQDGIIEWRHTFHNAKSAGAIQRFRPVIYHHLIVFGPNWKRVIEMWDNQDKCIPLGCPRWDSLPTRLPRDPTSTKRKVMIASARTPYFDDEQKKTIVRAYQDVHQYLKNREDIEIIWRIGGDLAQTLGIHGADLNGQTLGQQLAEADVVICAHSTMILEAMIVGCPAVLLDYFSYPSFIRAAWEISSSDHVAPVLDSALAEDPETMRFQQTILADSVVNLRTSATAVARYLESTPKSTPAP